MWNAKIECIDSTKITTNGDDGVVSFPEEKTNEGEKKGSCGGANPALGVSSWIKLAVLILCMYVCMYVQYSN